MHVAPTVNGTPVTAVTAPRGPNPVTVIVLNGPGPTAGGPELDNHCRKFCGRTQRKPIEKRRKNKKQKKKKRKRVTLNE